MQYLSKKNTLIVPENLSEVVEDWHMRYDKVVMSIVQPKINSRRSNRSPTWWLDRNLEKLFNSIKKLDRFTVSDHISPNALYLRVRIFSSDDHLVEFFYDRDHYSRPEIQVLAAIRVTVIHKSPKAYLEHVKILLSIEKMIRTGWSHISSIELSFDCLSDQEFEQVSKLVLLKFSRLKEIFCCDGSRSTSGKIVKKPGHSTTATNYINTNASSKQLKVYSRDDAISNISLERRRIELSFKRPFLRRKGLTTFSQVLEAGPDLFFNQLEFIHFDKSKIMRLQNSTAKGVNRLRNLSKDMVDELLENSSTVILEKLKTLVPWSTYRIKKDLGTKIAIPNFVFDATLLTM